METSLVHLPGTPSEAPPQAPKEEPAFDPVKYLRSKLDESKRYRAPLERGWFRNILFYVGQQWLAVNRESGRLEPMRLPDWVPTQITNRFASSCDAMASIFAQAKPTIVYGPSSNDEEDLAAADAASDVSDVCAEEAALREQRLAAKDWVALTGNAYVFLSYDTDPVHGVTSLPIYQCMACTWKGGPEEAEAGCPQCGQSLLQPSVDPATGQPETVEYPKGRLYSEVHGPLTVYYQAGMTFDASPFVIVAKTIPIETAKARWPGAADKLEANSAQTELGPMYQQALAYVTNISRGGGLRGLTGAPGMGPSSAGSMVTVFELFRRPDATIPGGYHGFLISDLELEGGEIEYRDQKGKPFVPGFHLGFKVIPGRSYAKTPADDLIYKQIQRNRVEAFIQLCLMRMGNPTWLLPEASNVSAISGQPGEVIRYAINPMSPGSKPDRVEGQAPPAFFRAWLTQIDDDFEELAATYDVMKGATPSNVPTLGGLELLRERGMGRYADALESWTIGWTKWTKFGLWIWRQYASDARERSVRGEDGRWKFQKLMAADITGNVDIRAEEEVAMPRSEGFKQLAAGQLLTAGLLDLTDPTVRLEYLKLFRMQHMMEPLDQDIKDAIKERDEFLETGGLRFRPDVDNNAVHADSHIKFAKTDKFRALPPEMQQVWLYHIQLHKEADQQARMAELQMAALAEAAPKLLTMQARGPKGQGRPEDVEAAKASGVPVGSMPGQSPNLVSMSQSLARA